jgi:hypothetical protein
MSAIPYTVAALVITGVACTASLATPPAGQKAQDLTCELRLTESGSTVTLSAEAQAHRAMRGTYTLTVDQRSGGGRSTIRQGGDFDLKPGERSVLGEARFNARARDINAELTLEANGQRKTCHRLTV